MISKLDEELERLSTRQVLEEAFKVIHPEPSREWEAWDNARIAEQREEDKASFMRWNDWRVGKQARFRRFLDAEAWTDAALCLVPEGKCWHIRYDPRLTGATVMDQDGFNQHHTLAETPALALLAACLEARENADG